MHQTKSFGKTLLTDGNFPDEMEIERKSFDDMKIFWWNGNPIQEE